MKTKSRAGNNRTKKDAAVSVGSGRMVRHSVAWTVEDMIARYPSLFQSRTQALHHLFVVLGCGYRWKDGKLIEVFREREADRIPRSAARILARHRTKLERPPYPYFDSCNLATVPPDADADWKAAAEEARADLPNAANEPRAELRHPKSKAE